MLTDEQKNEIIEQHRRVCGVTNRAIGSQNDIRFLALALAGEAGEFANMIKKEWMGFADPGSRKEQTEDELADVTIYLYLLHCAIGGPVNMSRAIDRKIALFWEKIRVLETGETK